MNYLNAEKPMASTGQYITLHACISITGIRRMQIVKISTQIFFVWLFIKCKSLVTFEKNLEFIINSFCESSECRLLLVFQVFLKLFFKCRLLRCGVCEGVSIKCFDLYSVLIYMYMSQFLFTLTEVITI